MKPFKFFSKPFNPRQYDFEGFTFIGVSPIKNSVVDGSPYRIMTYVDNRTNIPMRANRIRENEEPYHQADIVELIGERLYRLPRGRLFYLDIQYNNNETV